MVEVKVSDSIRKQPPSVKIIGNFIFKGRVNGQWLCPGGVGRHFQQGVLNQYHTRPKNIQGWVN